MQVTISTHKGREYCREHNRRNESVVSKQPHIDPTKSHENWIDLSPEEAFHEIFADAVSEYNTIQKRADRRIDDYYQKIVKDKKHVPVYEIIIGVYYDSYDETLCKSILREFVNTWNTRNPALKLIGAYYHNDEQSKRGSHVHIDYIPVGTGYKNGMKKQCSQEKALENMGFCTMGKNGKALASSNWIARENKTLEAICVAKGLTVIHPLTGDKHQKTNAYKKAKAEEEKLKKQLDNLKNCEQTESAKLANMVAVEEKLHKSREIQITDINVIKEKHSTITIRTSDFEKLKETQAEYNIINQKYKKLLTRYGDMQKEINISNNTLNTFSEKYQVLKNQQDTLKERLCEAERERDYYSSVCKETTSALHEVYDKAETLSKISSNNFFVEIMNLIRNCKNKVKKLTDKFKHFKTEQHQNRDCSDIGERER